MSQSQILGRWPSLLKGPLHQHFRLDLVSVHLITKGRQNMDGEANDSQEITEGAQEQVQGQGQQTASRQVDEGDEAGNAIAPNYDRGIRLLADVMDVGRPVFWTASSR